MKHCTIMKNCDKTIISRIIPKNTGVWIIHYVIVYFGLSFHFGVY